LLSFFVVEVAYGEKRNPCRFIMANTVSKEKGQRKVTKDCAWYGIHHPSQMYHRVKPKVHGICFLVR
jgi:hypothetical protein